MYALRILDKFNYPNALLCSLNVGIKFGNSVSPPCSTFFMWCVSVSEEKACRGVSFLPVIPSLKSDATSASLFWFLETNQLSTFKTIIFLSK